MAGQPERITWSATIDLPPGRYRYHCLLQPRMNGEVEVIPDDQAFDKTPEQIAEETRHQIAADTETADAMVDTLSDPASAYDPETGTWRVHVGGETLDGHVTVTAFLPGELAVPAGATVEYVAGTGEPSTVTFPPDLHGGFGCGPTACGQEQSPGLTPLAFPILCELDQAAAGLPGIPLYNLFAGGGLACMAGNLEWTVSPYMAHARKAPASEVATRATFHNSGKLFAQRAPTWDAGPFDEIPRYPSTFTARFPNAGEFSYACIAHGDFMTGLIRVASN
jgi:plastocyanin